MKSPAPDVTIQVVQRAMDLLGCFSTARPELSLTEISAALGVYKSTAYRLVATLEAGGFLSRDERTGRYRLGFRLLQICGGMLDQIDIRRAAEQPLQALARDTQETVVLHVLDQRHTVVVDRIASRQPVSFQVELGQRLPLHCTAAGKAILSRLSAEQQTAILESIGEEGSSAPPVDLGDLRAALGEARARGYIFHDGDLYPGVRAVAAPIFNHLGQPVAALVLAGLAIRIPLDRVPELAARVMETAAAISRAIGGPGTVRAGEAEPPEPAGIAPIGAGR